MSKRLTRRLLAAAALAALLPWSPAVPADERPLTVAFPSLGREVWGPLEGTASELFFTSGALLESLIFRGLGDDHELHPGLAESWTVSEDGLVYRLKLREGVEFHRGFGEMTSADVVNTFALIATPESRNPRKFVTGWIESIEAHGPYEVEFRLKSPQPTFLHQISSFNPYFMILSKRQYDEEGVEEANRNPVGTGPLALERHARSEVVELRAVPDHWRRTSDFERIDVRIVPEERTRLSMLQAGEADLIFISGASIAEVEAGGFKVLRNPGAFFINIVFGGQVLPEREGYDAESPWASREHAERSAKVREALCLAIDKEEIIARLLQGTGQPFGVNAFLPGATFTRDEWTPLPYDPARAQALLAEAGFPGGFDRPVNMLVIPSHGVEMGEIPEAVAMYWERLGLQVQRRVVDDAVWKDGWYPRSTMQRLTAYTLPTTPLFDPAD
jgi:peptide/nickel transport system substrate-binding protein